MILGRVCLIGDAFFIVRSHTAAATPKAVKNATSLAKSIRQNKWNIDKALDRWEKSRLAIGKYPLVLENKFINISQIYYFNRKTNNHCYNNNYLG